MVTLTAHPTGLESHKVRPGQPFVVIQYKSKEMVVKDGKIKKSDSCHAVFNVIENIFGGECGSWQPDISLKFGASENGLMVGTRREIAF